MTKLALLLLAVSSTVSFLFIPIIFSDTSQKEIDFANAIIHNLRQERKVMIPSAILTQYAKWKCSDMAERHYFNHITPEGIGPNEGVRNLGYQFPSYYDKNKDGNNIESLAYNYGTIQEAIEGFWNSPAHKVHVFGVTKFFNEQNEYGVAIYTTATEVFYCVEIAKPLKGK